MIEKPILFCGEMVKAVMDGRKTQTRRIVKRQPDKAWRNDGLGSISFAAWPYSMYVGFWQGPCGHKAELLKCPYGAPGDELWVRETHWLWGRWYKNGFNEAGKQKWTFRHLEGHAASQQVYYSATKDPHPEMRGATRESVGYHKRPSIFMPRWASRIQLRVTDVWVERVQEISGADANPWVWAVTFERIKP